MKKKWQIFAREYVVSLFPVISLVDSFRKEMGLISGRGVDVTYKIENHAAEYYNLTDNWRLAHLALVKKIKNNPAILRRFYKQMEKLGRGQIRRVTAVKKLLPGATNRELNNHYQTFLKSNRQVYAYGLLLPLLDYQEETFLSDELTRILKDKHAIRYFGLLTTPLRSTFNKQQELALLKIFQEIWKDKKLTVKFRRAAAAPLAEILKIDHPKIWRRLQRHWSQYNWTTYVYEGPSVDINYFIDVLRDLVRRRVNPSHTLRKFIANSRKLKQQQQAVLHQMKVNDYEKQLVNLARDAVFVKPYRRELQSHSYYLMESVLAEIARRLNLSLRQVRMMLPEEITAGLLKRKVNINLLNERIKLVVYGRRAGRRFCLSGQAARKFITHQVAREIRPKLSQEISGAVAFPGLARGKIKIINMPEEMIKMRSGNILVSAATAPNLMPAIRQAAAIVTDEGGLTCHAAIVSRELKIPCVVGTKIATRALRDGQIVEVDANRGIVKIIKR